MAIQIREIGSNPCSSLYIGDQIVRITRYYEISFIRISQKSKKTRWKKERNLTKKNKCLYFNVKNFTP